MNTKLLMVASATWMLLVAPAIAQTSNIKVQTNSVQITVDDEGEIDIQSKRPPVGPYRYRSPLIPGRDLYGRYSRLNCNGQTYRHRSQHSNTTGSGQVSTYSSSSTWVCQ